MLSFRITVNNEGLAHAHAPKPAKKFPILKGSFFSLPVDGVIGLGGGGSVFISTVVVSAFSIPAYVSYKILIIEKLDL